MRRRLWTVVIVSALLFALGWLEHAGVTDLTQTALEQTRSILDDIRAQDLEIALQKSRALDEMWDARAVRLEMMVDHRSTDEVRYALSKLIAALESGDPASAMVYGGELEGSIEHVFERQELSIQNIL